ncbi:alpha/beta-hydrolase [Vararia minispora EC-137]|uniref:Alpha/beta-hydrolase n=1 Tax=Vararia minispora EC-137 TaxID=1314806 RepID=A0ACB8QX13_9AGAM|nr:alpha/beta-hydrolase [Vararia minispora EC-137]
MRYGGLQVIGDTGEPAGVSNYVTLVLIHGFSFHSGIFSCLLPYSTQYKCRIVLVNRRGYPGAVPYSEEDFQLLEAAQKETLHGQESLCEFLKAGAFGIHQFIAEFIVEGGIPLSGGIILAGWSMCGAWFNALLAYGSTFPASDVDVASYLRRVVMYDPPYHALGFTPPSVIYNPLSDPDIPASDRAQRFSAWVSGYFAHPEDGSLEQHTPLIDPAPTLVNMKAEDVAANLAPVPTAPGGSDALVFTALPLGGANTIRRAALHPEDKEGWGGVEWRYVWCDRSAWEMPFGAAAMREELANARETGQETRKIVLIRWRGANHFAHWDHPEQTLKALLADGNDEIEIC